MKKKDIIKINVMYQEEAITCMAEMFDYVERHLHIDLKEYFTLFNKTKISDMFFALDVKYVLGKSSIEIVKEVLEINNVKYRIYDEILNKKETNLARCRVIAGYSQSDLATISGVSLRSIQMYEQRNKDINKASFSTIKSLARSLNVDMNDLYECANVGYENLISMY